MLVPHQPQLCAEHLIPIRTAGTIRQAASLVRVLAAVLLLALVDGLPAVDQAANAAFTPAVNRPGGGTGAGPEVTVTDNGDGTVTMANGIVAIVIVTATSRLNSVSYTYANNGTSRTSPILLGKGQYYYGGFMLGSGTYTYTLATDPKSNGGGYADVKLLSVSQTNGVMETHFSMLRGSHGYYSTAIQRHRPQDAAFEVGAWGVVTRVPPAFNWLSADTARNFQIGVPTSFGVKIPYAPHEITVNFNGSQEGAFADKFIYGQDHADQQAWGWSSVGREGTNIGVWMMTTMEFSNGGPMKRDVGVYAYNCLNNSILTGEIGMGSDGHLGQGEVWSKTCGPWFIYMNDVPATITAPAAAAYALYDDAVAQSAAERRAWPYSWFKHPDFVQESGRGSVTGTLVVHDSGDPNVSSAGLWVGLEQQPITVNGTHDFQKWLKPYQFWVRTDETGRFTIPHVLPGANYTLWAFGHGVAGTFVSQTQEGGNPPLDCDLPETPFPVRVTAQTVTALGTVVWTPHRVGATVFELGYPDRTASKFRHGEDFWSPESPPKLGFPTPSWGGQTAFAGDFPDGLSYTVGRSRWTTDWNYVLPSLPDQHGAWQPCQGTITFTLATAPAAGARAAIYLGCAGDDGGAITLSVNGTGLVSGPTSVGVPTALTATGFNPPYSDDSSIHFGNHGPFSDERITFPAGLLHAGANTLVVAMNAKSLTAYLMIDYLRLELTGYIPPAPSGVTASAGQQRTMVAWPLVPGATSYTVLRAVTGTGSATADGRAAETAIAQGVVGPVCGSGPSRMTWIDTGVTNNTTYHYRVISVNPGGQSPPSTASAAVTPTAEHAEGAPAIPGGLTMARSGHHVVDLRWSAVPGADCYRVWRTTLYADGTGGFYPLRTTLLDDAALSTTMSDTTVTDGRTYGYRVEAMSAGGVSAPSEQVTATPLPAPPTMAPGAFTGTWIKTRQGPALSLTWTPVPGATGYVIYRSTSAGMFRWPGDFRTTVPSTTYLDKNDKNDKADRLMKPGVEYWYQVTAVNTGGVSPSATTKVAPQ